MRAKPSPKALSLPESAGDLLSEDARLNHRLALTRADVSWLRPYLRLSGEAQAKVRQLLLSAGYSLGQPAPSKRTLYRFVQRARASV